MKNSKGFTLVQMVLGLAAGAVLALAAISALSNSLKHSQNLEATSDVQLNLGLAVQLLKQMGRLATVCRKFPGEVIGIQCDDYPMSGDQVALVLPAGSTKLQYLKFDPQRNVWIEIDRFENVVSFTLCSGNDLIQNTCPLKPDFSPLSEGINQFFRFRLVARKDSQSGNTSQYQGAFMTRNPVWGNAQVSYAR